MPPLPPPPPKYRHITLVMLTQRQPAVTFPSQARYWTIGDERLRGVMRCNRVPLSPRPIPCYYREAVSLFWRVTRALQALVCVSWTASARLA